MVDACVVPPAQGPYPVYDEEYRDNIDAVLPRPRGQLYPTLPVVGRNGMHKYNNQDHAMMTAMLTAQNILAGERRFDVWNVNEDAEYHEAGENPAPAGCARQRAAGSGENRQGLARGLVSTRTT